MRAAFLLEGLAVLVLGLLVFLLVRTSPATWAWSPTTWAVRDSRRRRPPRAGGHDSRPPAVPAAGCLSHRRPRRAGFSHLTVLYTTAGYDSASAALLISYLGLVICVSKILCGQIYDRFGSRAGNWYVHLVFLAGLLLCCLAHLGGCSPLSRP